MTRHNTSHLSHSHPMSCVPMCPADLSCHVPAELRMADGHVRREICVKHCHASRGLSCHAPADLSLQRYWGCKTISRLYRNEGSTPRGGGLEGCKKNKCPTIQGIPYDK